MTDNSFFASLTPDAQKETNLLLGGGTVGSLDQHHAITGIPSENQANEFFSGTNSGSSQEKSSNFFGSSYDYHQNSPAVQAAIQKLQSLSSAGSQTTTGYINAASSSATDAVKAPGVFLSRAALPAVSLYSGSYDEPGNGGISSSGGDGGGGSASNPSLLPAGPTGTELADSMNRIFYNSRDQIAHDYHGGSLTQAEMNSCYSEMDHLITHKHWAGYDALHRVEVEISRWASTTQNYQNMIQDVTGTAATDTDKAWINWAEDTIAKSVGGTSPYTGNTRAYTYQDARYNLVHSDRVTSVINQAYQWELGRAPDAPGLASQQNAMTDGQTITDIRRSMAFSAECTQDLRNEVVAVTGAQPIDTDNDWIRWVQSTMTDHPGYSLNDARSNLAHSDRVTQIIRSEYQDCLGRDADSSGIQSYENELANGATRGDIHYQLAHSSEAYNNIETIVRDEIGISAPNQAMVDSLQDHLSNNMTLQEIANNLPYMQPQQFDLSLPGPETNEDVVNNNATLKDYISNSPTATQEYNELTAQGWKIKYINAGSETQYNQGSGGTIYINAAYKNVPSSLMSQLAHEMGHALNKVKIDYSSQDSFVNSNLYGEGVATVNNIKIYYELKDTATEITVAGSSVNVNTYIYDYNKGVKDNNISEAYRDIGDYYGKHEVTGNNIGYYDYYANWYKSHH